MISTFRPYVCITLSSFSCLLVPFRFEYLFNFDNTFEIHDDIEVLKRMGMSFGLEKGQCEEANLRTSRTMVPKALEPYVMGKTVKRLFVKLEWKYSWVYHRNHYCSYPFYHSLCWYSFCASARCKPCI